MTSKKLQALIATGETTTCDLKLECNAFNGGGATAELVKDICAMANNGTRKSHLIIGVSNNRSRYKSVRNSALTDDAVQDLVKTAIFPIPNVVVEDVEIKVGSDSYSLKVLTIGPGKRTAHRFARDFIDYGQRYAFRRHEVWIRRNATSDLATPEEVARLVEGEDLATVTTHPESNQVYSLLPSGQRHASTLKDIETADPRITRIDGSDVLRITIDGVSYIMRVVYIPEKEKELSAPLIVQRSWGFEDGIIFLAPNGVPKDFLAAVPLILPGEILTSKESWGHYALAPIPGSGERPVINSGFAGEYFGKALRNGPPMDIPIFIIAPFKDTSSLTAKLRKAVDAMSESRISTSMQASQAALHLALQDVAQSGVAYVNGLVSEMSESVDSASRKDGPDEYRNDQRFGKGIIVSSISDDRWIAQAQYMIDASTAPPNAVLPPPPTNGEAMTAARLELRDKNGWVRGRMMGNGDPMGLRLIEILEHRARKK